jgi:MoxR-like ATPase
MESTTAHKLQAVRTEVARKIVGQENVYDRILMALLTGGHVLLEGLPGLAKTLTIQTVAEALDLGFRRVQFTPDLLPADIVGTQIYQPQSGTFQVQKGPVFTDLVLADEVNRAPAKVQSALLEAMAERQVTIAGESHKLSSDFMVMATQNPLEQEGTYRLPEAQLDRFLYKVVVGYSSYEEESQILSRFASGGGVAIEPKMTREELASARKEVAGIHVDPKVRDYIVKLVIATRDAGDPCLKGAQGLKAFQEISRYVRYGVSPRGTICLDRSARATAYLAGRDFVTPQDVKDSALDVLRHRVILGYDAEADNVTSQHYVSALLETVPVP